MDFKDKKAIYLQIADLFLQNILRKSWKAEEKIPSIRSMAIELEVNPNTAMRTYSYLQELGIIYNKRGVGYFVDKKGYDITMKIVKYQFLNEDLPSVFNTIDLLEMPITEIIDLYNKQQNNSHEKQ